MRELGRKGGKKRLKAMTAERRSEIARQAGLKSAEARKKKKAEAASTAAKPARKPRVRKERSAA